MRRGPTLVMCAMTGLVVVTNLRAGATTGLSAAAGVEPTGVVLLPPAAAPASPAARRAAAKRSTPTHRATTAPRPKTTRTASSTHTPTSTRTTAPRPAAPKPAAKPAPTAARQTSVVVNGRAVSTRYGTVQVQITISGHRITRADAIAFPHGSGQTNQISSYAIPRLDSETLSAQSGNIDTVSGATYTSAGYRTSLQSALDSARAAGVW